MSGRRTDLEADAEANIVRGDTTLLDEFLAEGARPSRHTVHFVSSRGQKTACGLEGVSPNTNVGSDVSVAVTCEACRSELAQRTAAADRSGLKRLAKGPVSVRDFSTEIRRRLIDAGRARQVGGSLFITLDGITFLGLGLAKTSTKVSAAPRRAKEVG